MPLQADLSEPPADQPSPSKSAPPQGLARLFDAMPRLFVPAFTIFFLGFALLYAAHAVSEIVMPLLENGDLTKGLFKGLHTGVVALAVYELAEIMHQEYEHHGRPQNAIVRIRRGVARFGSVVVVALVLESLIMVIKYSQQDLAGFLYYPAAIIASAAVLLVALGLFTRLTSLPIRQDSA
ncbi:MAG: hypothetical protein EPN19_02430 [Betaproteobacteria bacterium]|nr:MAG: hypothetical protein EPN19_02430 [Betaproteobacteria bacterium]